MVAPTRKSILSNEGHNNDNVFHQRCRGPWHVGSGDRSRLFDETTPSSLPFATSGDAGVHAACPVELKKKIVRTMVQEVVVNEPSKGHLQFVIHWKGGTHTAFEMIKPRPATAQKTAEDDLEIIRKMSLLPMKQVVPFAPWEIRRSDLDSPAVQRQVARLKKTGRLHLKRDPSSQQGKLFE